MPMKDLKMSKDGFGTWTPEVDAICCERCDGECPRIEDGRLCVGNVPEEAWGLVVKSLMRGDGTIKDIADESLVPFLSFRAAASDPESAVEAVNAMLVDAAARMRASGADHVLFVSHPSDRFVVKGDDGSWTAECGGGFAGCVGNILGS